MADHGGRSSADFQFENRIGYAKNRSNPTQPSARACRRDEFPYLDRQKWRPEEGDRSRRSSGRKSPFSGGWSCGRCRGRAGS
ncbi:hypothetical protein L3X38_001123 [Prunus dulcis]|uniref:Uncharacterized protein n=1 Tax=Prunus dulcis TaxID=3755 RepID=A0AAD4WS27_PRUDU|nr:hypothetical protein L3X38_001123 [Prunus dulcis]